MARCGSTQRTRAYATAVLDAARPVRTPIRIAIEIVIKAGLGRQSMRVAHHLA
ncbi:MAG: hypothetical protein AVDCRST_MAG26-3498, partial [uncultured Chloroflexia bacterium]